MKIQTASAGAWPDLSLPGWTDSCTTLHLWLQIVGKVRLANSPWLNHSWHVTLYVTPRGLTTSSIPYDDLTFQIDFDFIAHRLTLQTSDGRSAGLPLEAQPVADFYRRLQQEMTQLGLAMHIQRLPNELLDPVRFDQDRAPRVYNRDCAQRLWQAFMQADRVFKEFRTRFIGKCSPVHLFWGGADLAVTRFSGRRAPQHPGGIPHLPDWVTREAYSHEVSSCGFWPGGGAVPYPAFYAYAYPQPPGFADASIEPAGAFYSKEFGEFILPYSVVQQAASPDETLLEFLQSTYAAAAELGKWDRTELERSFARPMSKDGQSSS